MVLLVGATHSHVGLSLTGFPWLVQGVSSLMDRLGNASPLRDRL